MFSSIPVHTFIVFFSNENLGYYQNGVKRCEKNLILLLFYLDSNDKFIVIFTFVKTNCLNFEKMHNFGIPYRSPLVLVDKFIGLRA